MKKTIVALTLLLTVIVVGLGSYGIGYEKGKNYDPTSTYTAPARVIEADEATGWITFVDWAGEAWSVRGENYEVGQLLIVVFNDNATETIYDDLVIDIECLENAEEVN